MTMPMIALTGQALEQVKTFANALDFKNPNNPSNDAYMLAMRAIYVREALAPEMQAQQAANASPDELQRLNLTAQFNKQMKGHSVFRKGFAAEEQESLAQVEGYSDSFSKYIDDMCQTQGISFTEAREQVDAQIAQGLSSASMPGTAIENLKRLFASPSQQEKQKEGEEVFKGKGPGGAAHAPRPGPSRMPGGG